MPINRGTGEPRPRAPQKIPESFISELLARVDVVEVVGRYVPLKKHGANYLGLCPFHGEKTASFTVTPSKQFFHCFGCGKNGDALAFLMEHGALTFREAVTELAQGVGLQLPSDGGEQSAADAAHAESVAKILQAHDLAAAFFRHCLAHTEHAKEYLRGRKVPQEATARFIIGFAPGEWQGLKEAFPDYASNGALVDCGLVVRKDETGRRYDRFRNRLMFGIRDPRGRLLGFGGRSLDGSDPKYMNSPESALFDKSGALFGVYEARDAIRRKKRVIVTEGYMDTVAHHMNGLEETVATMGTACTPQHVERLQALAPETIFAFDGDKAGYEAAWKALKTCLPFASDTHTFRFLLLPEGDPDELIIARGAEAYRELVDNALSLSGFLMTSLAKKHHDLAAPEDRAHFHAEGSELIKRLPYGGRLYRIVRDELSKASRLSPAQIEQLARQSSEKQRPARRSPWAALTEAAKAQPRTAAEHAEAILETLPAPQQDAFFAGTFESFAAEERPFWQALYAAATAADAPDSNGDLAIAQRDLLAGAPKVINEQRARDERAQLLDAFLQGQAPAEALFRRPAPGRESA